MIDSLLAVPDLVGGFLTATLATFAGISVYLISYRLISRYQSSDLKDPASGLFRGLPATGTADRDDFTLYRLYRSDTVSDLEFKRSISGADWNFSPPL